MRWLPPDSLSKLEAQMRRVVFLWFDTAGRSQDPTGVNSIWCIKQTEYISNLKHAKRSLLIGLTVAYRPRGETKLGEVRVEESPLVHWLC